MIQKLLAALIFFSISTHRFIFLSAKFNKRLLDEKWKGK